MTRYRRALSTATHFAAAKVSVLDKLQYRHGGYEVEEHVDQGQDEELRAIAQEAQDGDEQHGLRAGHIDTEDPIVGRGAENGATEGKDHGDQHGGHRCGC